MDADIAKDVAPNIVGQIQLRPFCGDSVHAGRHVLLNLFTFYCVIMMPLAMTIIIVSICATVPDLHNKFILTADAVRRLSDCDAKLSRISARSSSKSDNFDNCLIDDDVGYTSDKSDDNVDVIHTLDDNHDITDDNEAKASSDVKNDDFATNSDDSVTLRGELIKEQ